MDVKYINPFIESFEAVMPQIGFGNIQKGNLSVKGQELINSGVIIIVGIVGSIKGNVAYCIGMNIAKKIASVMMGAAIDDLDEMAQSALSELANMLTASAVTYFYDLGIPVDISTPTLLHGKNISVNMNSSQVLCIQLLADQNPIDINIAFEQ